MLESVLELQVIDLHCQLSYFIPSRFVHNINIIDYNYKNVSIITSTTTTKSTLHSFTVTVYDQSILGMFMQNRSITILDIDP